ncbi:replicative DNA helicase [Bacillus sp. ISL-47]|uniref:replicative DNA helicase n=1 Tax=Bacillus sp. ISL-47 TaxID=2819130 RepID=UPI001BE9474E|nr:replicative DNA helicase [Pseudomonas sp. ISL-84]
MFRRIEQQIQNEQFFLGSILQDWSLIEEASLQPKHFYHNQHKALFTKMLELKKQGQRVDLYVMSQLGDSAIDSFGGFSYLSELASCVPSISIFYKYQEQIYSFWMIQQAKESVNKFLEEAEDVIDPILLMELLERLSALELDIVKGRESFRELMAARYEEHLSSPESGLSGVDTGYPNLNVLTDGWQHGDLIIIGARPSMGKTAFALNIVLNGCRKDNIKAMFFSLEMSKEQIVDRLIALAGEINLMKMKNPNKHFSQDDWNRYHRAVAILDKLHLETSLENSVPAMRALIRKSVRENRNKKHVIIIDFLTLIKPTKRGTSRHHEIEQIVLDLKRMAVELKVPIIVLAQLSRQIEQRQDRRPLMSDLRESGAIEQTADMILFLYRDDYYNQSEKRKGITEIHVAKNRNGAIGKLEMRFIRETNVFKPLNELRIGGRHE